MQRDNITVASARENRNKPDIYTLLDAPEVLSGWKIWSQFFTGLRGLLRNNYSLSPNFYKKVLFILKATELATWQHNVAERRLIGIYRIASSSLQWAQKV